jgi:SLOG family protein
MDAGCALSFIFGPNLAYKPSFMNANKRKSVFISGSAYEYGSFGDEGKSFIRELSKALLQQGFTIISGFGSGVGNYVVEGALEGIYTKGEKMHNQLRVYPFPALGPLVTEIQRHYREDIIGQAETAIFLFGNKLEDIEVREADGMRKEFEIARHQKARLIPVGASGYISARLWSEMVQRYDDYFENRAMFGLYERLGDPCAQPDELIDAILQIAQ